MGKIKSTKENLADAIAGETHEYQIMYPEFTKVFYKIKKYRKDKLIMVKKVELYECPICHTRFKAEDRAILCEKTHKQIDNIIDMRYISTHEYPETITIKFKEGKTIEYFKGKQI